MNRSALSKNDSQGAVLFSQYSDNNQQRAGKLEYGIYPVVDDSAEGENKDQIFMRLEKIKLNANYNQNALRPAKSSLKLPNLDEYPNLNALINDQWNPNMLRNANSFNDLGLEYGRSNLGKIYSIPLKPKYDHEVFRDLSDEDTRAGSSAPQ